MQKRIFWGVMLGLLALNVAINGYIYVGRQSFMASVAQGTVQQPTSAPVVGVDVPPPNPLREGGPALPIMLLLPVAMLLLTIGCVVWYRSRKRLSKSIDIEQPIS